MNLVPHARTGTVKWRCASVFAVAGTIGAFGESSLSKVVDGQKLLALFAIPMLVVGSLMFARCSAAGDSVIFAVAIYMLGRSVGWL